MFGRIVVPVDYDESSRLAVETGARLAEKFKAAVVLVHVCVYPLVAGPQAPVIRPDITEDQRNRARELLARQHSLFPSGVQVEDRVADGEPADQIVTIAKNWQADLVIVASHQRVGLARLVLGSVAEVVIRYAPCAVLVARPRDENPA